MADADLGLPPGTDPGLPPSADSGLASSADPGLPPAWTPDGGAPWTRLHPLTLVHLVAEALPSLLLLGVLLLLGTGGARRVVGGLAFAVATLLLVGPVALARYLRFRYRLMDEGVEVESGLFARQHRLIPYDRLQAVEVERPAMARLLGTARVGLMTGAGTGAEATLAYVSMAEADRLRQRLHARREAMDGATESAERTTADEARPRQRLSLIHI